MAWVRLDDQFFHNTKARSVGPEGRELFLASACYAAMQLNNGCFIVEDLPVIAALAQVTPDIADLLISHDLWHSEGHDCPQCRAVGQLMPVPSGYIAVHEYLSINPSREKVLADRGIARRRSAMNADPELRAALKARDGDSCRYCGTTVSWRDRKGPKGATYDHVIPVAAGGDESLENLVVCCRDCNVRKNSRTPEQSGMSLIPARSSPNRSNHQSRPPSRPVPDTSLDSSSGNSRGPVDNPDDDDFIHRVPDETWDAYAELRLRNETPGQVKSPVKWKTATARNARDELGDKALGWWRMFAITPRHLAECLVDDHAPRNVPRRDQEAK